MINAINFKSGIHSRFNNRLWLSLAIVGSLFSFVGKSTYAQPEERDQNPETLLSAAQLASRVHLEGRHLASRQIDLGVYLRIRVASVSPAFVH
jgi:hypothetical protein